MIPLLVELLTSWVPLTIQSFIILFCGKICKPCVLFVSSKCCWLTGAVEGEYLTKDGGVLRPETFDNEPFEKLLIGIDDFFVINKSVLLPIDEEIVAVPVD